MHERKHTTEYVPTHPFKTKGHLKVTPDQGQAPSKQDGGWINPSEKELYRMQDGQDRSHMFGLKRDIQTMDNRKPTELDQNYLHINSDMIGDSYTGPYADNDKGSIHTNYQTKNKLAGQRRKI